MDEGKDARRVLHNRWKCPLLLVGGRATRTANIHKHSTIVVYPHHGKRSAVLNCNYTSRTPPFSRSFVTPFLRGRRGFDDDVIRSMSRDGIEKSRWRARVDNDCSSRPARRRNSALVDPTRQKRRSMGSMRPYQNKTLRQGQQHTT